jgi:putative addiction module component (TIGR02574 family)
VLVTKSAENLLREALQLPESERAEIAAKLIQSLEPEADADVDAAWAAEIERRCAALDSGEAVTSDWADVRRRIESEIFGR